MASFKGRRNSHLQRYTVRGTRQCKRPTHYDEVRILLENSNSLFVN
jgi:hypothetical protein